MSAPTEQEVIYVTAADCIRDRVFVARIEHRLKSVRVPVRLERGPEHEPPRVGLRRDIEEAMERARAVLALYSREAAADRWVGFELECARRRNRPVLLLLYPEIDPPPAPADSWVTYDLRGFVDSGPALPPGTDEGRFFHRSEFVEESLAFIESYVRSLLGSGPGPDRAVAFRDTPLAGTAERSPTRQP